MKQVTTMLAMAWLCVFSFQEVKAQYPAGTPAPDFTATDINGVSYNLYTLLNQGKTVFLDFSTTWCTYCWQYHQTHALKDLYTQYGPSGTNEVMVFYIESDASTTLANLNGQGGAGITQGNWVTGTPYPIIDNATIQNNYYVQGYPGIYMICPNKTVTELWQMTAAQLYQRKQSACPNIVVTATAAFTANTTTPCPGNTVNFTDQSSGNPTAWNWAFSPNTVTYTGGTSASSQNPKVQFNGNGPYTVTLTITAGSATDNEVKTGYIVPNSTSVSLPVTENFEGTTFPPTGWTMQNSDAPSIAWGTNGAKGLERRAAVGNANSASGCAGLNSFNYPDTTKTEALISSRINLTGATTPRLTFRRAYKNYVSTTNPQFYREELKVFVSTDCGMTWGNPVYFKKGAQLATSGSSTATFNPATAADWDLDTVNLSSYIGQTINVKFEFGSKYGNNLYLDDISVSNVIVVTSSVSIASSAANNSICANSSVTFTATPTNGGTPTYQWKVNGTNVGTNSPTYTVTSLTNGQIVTCVMTSSVAGTSPATSNAITMVVNPSVTPSTSINITAGGNPTCVSQSVTFTATPTNGGTTPAYQWKVNGANVGTNTPTYSTSTITNNAVVSCVMTSNAACPSTPTATSNAITMQVTTSVTPAVTISNSNSATVLCAGSSVTFTAAPVNGGTNPTYSWRVNGTQVSTNATFTSTTLTNGAIVTCIMTSNSSCASTPTASSNAITISLTPSVTPSVVTTTANLSICQGETAVFNVTGTNGGTNPTYQWMVNGSSVAGSGAQFSSATLSNGANVSCIMTSNAACVTTASTQSNVVHITVNPRPVFAVSSNSPICAGETLNLSSTTMAGAIYAWSGPNSYASNSQNPTIVNAGIPQVGSYSLRVTQNGCTSVEVANVTVNPAPPVPTITKTGNLLVSSATAGNQWYFNSTILPGATSPTTTITGNGTYMVTVTSNGCSSHSQPYIMTNASLADLGNMGIAMQIFPNPTTGISSLQFDDAYTGEIQIEVKDVKGQLIERTNCLKSESKFEKEIDFSGKEHGMYFIHVRVGDKTSIFKVLYM